MKIRRSYLMLLVVGLLAVTFFTVYAGLTFREASANVGSISGSFIYTGAGKGDNVEASVNVSGTGLSAFCVNPAGKIAPGQSTFEINVSLTQTYKADRSGRVEGSYYFNILPDASTAGCPNKKWSVASLQGTAYVTLNVVNTSKNDGDTAVFMCDLSFDGPCAQIQ